MFVTRAVLVLAALAACGGSSTKPGPTTVPVKSGERQTDDELQAACARKHAESCIDLGARYAQGDGVDVDQPRAAKLFEQACTLGDQDGCAWFAMGIAQGVAQGDVVKAYAMLESACAKAVLKGCRGVGYLKYEGRGTAKDIPGATAVLAKACAANDGTSCGILAVLYLNEVKDTDKARDVAKRGCELDASFACFVAAALTSETVESTRLLAKACDLGDGEACTKHGAILLRSSNDTDPVKAVKVLERGCSLGAPKACRALGGALIAGVPGVAPDDTKAAKVLLKSCEGGDLSGCAVLGIAYATGRGVPKDLRRGIELFRQACEQGTNEPTATGCYYLAVSYATGEGIAQNHAEAAKYHGIACDRSWGEACAALADQYTAGQGVKPDATKAAELNHRACELDYTPACMKDRKAP